MLRQGEKELLAKPVRTSRSRLPGWVEIKAFIKKYRANVWKGRKWTQIMLTCTYMDVGFLGVVPFKCS